MKRIYILLFVFNFFSVIAQEREVNLHFDTTIENTSLRLNKSYYLPSLQDSIQIETFKFYISEVQLLLDETIVESLKKKHFLIDLEKKNSNRIKTDIISNKDFNKIKFHIGIDSLTNVSGAFGEDLDPTNGMYWTWQSGYINLKIEGKSDVFQTRKNQFQFHIGGYQEPANTLQTVILDIVNEENITINVTLDEFFSELNPKVNHTVMSPNNEAVELSTLFSSVFSIIK
ncbi:MAG: hypothetical protein ACI9SJ_002363 [Flavobacteriaceae bacterium]|jgi:hypothetical protein|uniref:MbnP family protein n=1 Tax=Candidatus Marifrigoribacter sp. Uisw_064 TaxID=3230970 RepID=UPI003AE7DCFE